MTLYYEDAGLRLFHGSNKDILPTLPEASYDSIVTDPPYELGFMGKSWDSSGIAYDVDLWQECLRVLKPGGYLLAFGGTRTWHRIAAAIEDAGFEIRDSIAWMYGSGFPKSMDVSKAIDKAMGAERHTPTSRHADGVRVDPVGMATQAKGARRCTQCGKARGGRPTHCQCDFRGTAVTEEAEAWEGWGTALKPAFEPIIVARKPLVGTVVVNVLAYGTGALNIDGCRVASSSTDDVNRSRSGGFPKDGYVSGTTQQYLNDASPAGRWPSNVVLDESQAAALDEQSGVLTSGTGAVKRASSASRDGNRGAALGKESRPEGTEMVSYGDSGGASRFFPIFRYEAKAPSSERPEVDGTVHATVKPLELMRWLVRLVTRRGGAVLDLFAGSGTTGEAALLEGMQVTLIELEADHLPLILQRVRKPLQPSMFGDWEGDVA